MKLICLIMLLCASTGYSEKYGRGLVRPFGAEKRAIFLSPAPMALPEEYDLRALGLLSPIRNQGGCGSCWAFGTIDAFESNALVQGGPSLYLSTQQLVNCLFDGCGGGYFAFDYLEGKGVTTNANLPYRANDGRCSENFDKKYFATEWYRIGAPNKEPTVDEVKTAIVKYGAVAITVYADGSWDNYSGGVKNSCRKGSTNHIVTLVGWHKDNTWILKNSWSKDWGDQGYGYFPFGCNWAGSEEAAVGVFKNEVLKAASKELKSMPGKGVLEMNTEAGKVSIIR